MTILDEIATDTRLRVGRAAQALPLARLQAQVCAQVEAAGQPRFPFEDALARPGLSFLCEVKRASPSKGLIAPVFDPVASATAYERAGADAVSVLTEPRWFLGSDDDLRQAAAAVPLPVLRKDFVVDDYQLWQAKALGARAVLLIVALHDDATLRRRLALAGQLGLSALVEAHDEAETVRALEAGARLVGLNNRDLRSFTVDLTTTERCAPLIGPDVLLVAESGLGDQDAVVRMHQAGADAVLVGEALMRASDQAAGLAALKARLPQIKLCGLTRPEDVAAVNQCRPDYAGFVLAPSRRQVTPAQAASLSAGLHPSITPVGVFVDAEPSGIAALARSGAIRMAQLHGHEDDATVAEVKRLAQVPVIKAVRMAESPNLSAWPSADALLLDSTAGSGRAFDWASIPAGLPQPFFLAGGIGVDTIRPALGVPGVRGVDVSSGAETDGVKDPALMARLVRAAHSSGNPRREGA